MNDQEFFSALDRLDEMDRNDAKKKNVKAAVASSQGSPGVLHDVSPTTEDLKQAGEAGLERGTLGLAGFEPGDLEGAMAALTHPHVPKLADIEDLGRGLLDKPWLIPQHMISAMTNPAPAMASASRLLNPEAYDAAAGQAMAKQQYREEPSLMSGNLPIAGLTQYIPGMALGAPEDIGSSAPKGPPIPSGLSFGARLKNAAEAMVPNRIQKAADALRGVQSPEAAGATVNPPTPKPPPIPMDLSELEEAAQARGMPFRDIQPIGQDLDLLHPPPTSSPVPEATNATGSPPLMPSLTMRSGGPNGGLGMFQPTENMLSLDEMTPPAIPDDPSVVAQKEMMQKYLSQGGGHGGEVILPPREATQVMPIREPTQVMALPSEPTRPMIASAKDRIAANFADRQKLEDGLKSGALTRDQYNKARQSLAIARASEGKNILADHGPEGALRWGLDQNPKTVAELAKLTGMSASELRQRATALGLTLPSKAK